MSTLHDILWNMNNEPLATRSPIRPRMVVA